MPGLVAGGPVGADESHSFPGHPERPARAQAAWEAVKEVGFGSDLVVAPARKATRDELEAVHDGSYLDWLEQFCANGGGFIDPDTYATEGFFELARTAAGTALAVVETMSALSASTGVVVARPPGHHATASRAMGFCLINTVAVIARWLARRSERVCIVDWDVHHGNGTQEIFWDDSAVGYISTHQWGIYPGTGRADELGGADAYGLTRNFPLPSGATGDSLLRALEIGIGAIVDALDPSWLIVSAGYDAHRADPLAGLAFSEWDYGHAAALLRELTPKARLVLVLEGGYDLNALRGGMLASLLGAMGEKRSLRPHSTGGPGQEEVERAAQLHRQLAG